MGAGFHRGRHPGILEWIARLSLTQVLRPFEQGLLSASLVGASHGGVRLRRAGGRWLPLGVQARDKVVRSIVVVFAVPSRLV